MRIRGLGKNCHDKPKAILKNGLFLRLSLQMKGRAKQKEKKQTTTHTEKARIACTIDWSWNILPRVLHPPFMGKSSTTGLDRFLWPSSATMIDLLLLFPPPFPSSHRPRRTNSKETNQQFDSLPSRANFFQWYRAHWLNTFLKEWWPNEPLYKTQLIILYRRVYYFLKFHLTYK